MLLVARERRKSVNDRLVSEALLFLTEHVGHYIQIVLQVFDEGVDLVKKHCSLLVLS